MNIKVDYFRAIPELKSMDGWKNNVIDTQNPMSQDPCVAVGPYSEFPEIASDGVYYGERETSPYNPGELNGSMVTAFMRKGVAERLVEAGKRLPPRCLFMALDPLRTEQTQTALFEPFKARLMEAPFDYSEEKAIAETQQFVSLPSRPNSPHMTGGAVDLTILQFRNDASFNEYQKLTNALKTAKKDNLSEAEIDGMEDRRDFLLRHDAQMLDFGVAFDEVALDEKNRDKTALRYYEQKLAEDGIATFSERDKTALQNRRLLFNVLKSVGITMYLGEPWHADFGNKFYAQQSGNAAIYPYAEPSAQNKAHELMRQEKTKTKNFIADEYQNNPDYSEEVKLAMKWDHPRRSTQPSLKAQRIMPAVPAPKVS